MKPEDPIFHLRWLALVVLGLLGAWFAFDQNRTGVAVVGVVTVVIVLVWVNERWSSR